MLEGSQDKHSEPALESCMTISRCCFRKYSVTPALTVRENAENRKLILGLLMSGINKGGTAEPSVPDRDGRLFLCFKAGSVRHPPNLVKEGEEENG